MSGRALDLSVILPCYGGAALAARSVDALTGYLGRVGLTWEVVVVDDGGNDFARHPLPPLPEVRLLDHGRNRGKGAAVRTGMLAAQGRARIYTDVDLPYDLDLIPTIARLLQDRFHLVVGDRTMPGATYRGTTSPARRLLSAVATRVIGSLVTGGFFDTQCGLKGVRGEVADALFPLVAIDGFAFDVEVVYLALKHRLDIKRIPVRLLRNETSSVRALRDAAIAPRDVLGMKVRQMRGGYRSAELDAMLLREFAEVRSGIPPLQPRVPEEGPVRPAATSGAPEGTGGDHGGPIG